MGNWMTRSTIVWLVGAAVVGAGSAVLHLLRSELGGSHTGLPLAVGAFGLMTLAALMLYHGVVLAAREQDTQAGPAPSLREDAPPDTRSFAPASAPEPEREPELEAEPDPDVEVHDALTFHTGRTRRARRRTP